MGKSKKNSKNKKKLKRVKSTVYSALNMGLGYMFVLILCYIIITYVDTLFVYGR